MNDATNILEIFLENQKRKHINQGALGALGLVLISMIMNNRQNSENNQLFNISEISPENATSADGLSQGGSGSKTECAGTYPVSGYTRADGTEVSAYTRSCGAIHNGNSNSKSEHIEEPDYYAENEGYDVLEGHVEKNEEVEKESQEKSHFESKKPSLNTLESLSNTKDAINKENTLQYSQKELEEIFNTNYSELGWVERLQKKTAQYKNYNERIPLKDYYKISLDLADNADKVVSNKRYQVYKVSDLPSDYNKDIVYEKIAKGMNVNLSNAGRKNLFKEMRVVVPNENSKLLELIKNSNEVKVILQKENKNIIDGKYINKYFPNGIEFKKPHGKNLLEQQWRDKATLFGVIHNADIYNIRKNNDGSINLIITDFYDFENWEIKEKEGTIDWIIKTLNNNAEKQQKAGELVPYVLYIPIKFTQEELEELIKGKIN